MDTYELMYIQEFVKFLDYINFAYPSCGENIKRICCELSNMVDKATEPDIKQETKLCPKCKSELSVEHCGEVPAINDIEVLSGYLSDDISTMYANKIKYVCHKCGYVSVAWDLIPKEK